jgi:HAD superfamily hydrolase (TIGR01509 family)
MPIEAVLFDFNGVIIDDEPLHNEAWREVLTPLGLTYTDEEFYGPLLGVPDYEFFRLLLARRGRTIGAAQQQELQTAKNAIYARLVTTRQLDPAGLREFVRDLATHAPLGVVSGARRDEIEWHLGRLGLRDCFAAIVAAGEYAATKPDPAPFLTGLAAVEKAAGRPLAPARTVAIEDSANGVRSALAAGMPTLGVDARIPRGLIPGCFAYVRDFAGLTYAALGALLDGRG